MITRLTASLIAFCIALPMCWCCGAAGQSQEEIPSCCSMSQKAASEQPTPEPNCPCAKHENKRELTGTQVKAPLLTFKLLAALSWKAAAPNPSTFSFSTLTRSVTITGRPGARRRSTSGIAPCSFEAASHASLEVRRSGQ